MGRSTDIRVQLEQRTFEFAVRIVRLCRYLENKRKISYRLTGQLLAAGTSIGANVQESHAAESTSEFIYKRSIALRESREAVYWLRLLIAAEIVNEPQVNDLLNEAKQIGAMLARSMITLKQKRQVTQKQA